MDLYEAIEIAGWCFVSQSIRFVDDGDNCVSEVEDVMSGYAIA